jgi:tryptophan synthase alpha chain
MNPVDAVFKGLRGRGRKAFIAFLTAGDPDPAATVRFARACAAAGADLLELGFPYSDPLADGPVIQASYTRVLGRGLRLDDVFACAEGVARTPEFARGAVPLVAMASCSLVYHRGPAAFLDRAATAGFSGAIVPDLPADESDELARLAAARDFKLIQLVTPTTPRERAREIARRSTGFLYCVSVAGITGERDRLPGELLEQLTWLRTQTDLPLCVGFGISRPEHVRMLREVADGVIVGSALVRQVERAGSRPAGEAEAAVAGLVRSLAEALNPAG